MAESKETVLGIIEQIFQAREPASVTNRMVATVMEYLVEKIVTEGDVDDLVEVVAALRSALDNETNERSSADTALSGRVTALETLPSILSGIETAISELRSGKANTSDVAAALLQKADAADVAAALDLKANASEVNAALGMKANTKDVAAALDQKANTSDVAAALLQKADAADVSAALDLKADAAEVTALGERVSFLDRWCGYVFNVSEYMCVNVVAKQYATLHDALQDVPVAMRRAGLSVLFVEYGSMLYRHWRLESTTWTDNADHWTEFSGERKISGAEMDEVLGGAVPSVLVDATGAAVLDSEGNPIEIL